MFSCCLAVLRTSQSRQICIEVEATSPFQRSPSHFVGSDGRTFCGYGKAESSRVSPPICAHVPKQLLRAWPAMPAANTEHQQQNREHFPTSLPATIHSFRADQLQASSRRVQSSDGVLWASRIVRKGLRPGGADHLL